MGLWVFTEKSNFFRSEGGGGGGGKKGVLDSLQIEEV